MSRNHAVSFCLSAILTAVVAAAAPAQEMSPEEASAQLQALVESGQEQYNAGDYEAAVGSFSQVIQASGGANNPTYALLALLRAKAYTGLEEYEAALEDLKEALTYGQAQPGLVPEVQNARAEVYMGLNAYQQALPDLQEATKANRGNPLYQFNLGKTLVKLGGGVQAEKPLTRYLDSPLAEESEEQRAEALSLRGQAFTALGKSDKAIADFDASLAIDPTNHETYVGRATLALQEEDYEEAARQMRLAIENYTPLREDDELPYAEGYLTLAFALEEIGKAAEDEDAKRAAYTAQVAECDKLLELLPEDRQETLGSRAAALFRKGVGERLLGDFSAAVKSFTQAVRINPALGEAYFRRGICYFYLSEPKLAIRDFEQASGINFDVPRASLWKGVAYAKLGDYTAAIRSHGESIAVSDRYTPAYVNRALVQIRLGEYEKALEDLNEAIRLEPTEPEHYYRRGRVYSFLGDRERAIQSLMKSLEFDERFGPAYGALDAELRQNGQSELADVYRQRKTQLGL